VNRLYNTNSDKHEKLSIVQFNFFAAQTKTSLGARSGCHPGYFMITDYHNNEAFSLIILCLTKIGTLLTKICEKNNFYIFVPIVVLTFDL